MTKQELKNLVEELPDDAVIEFQVRIKTGYDEGIFYGYSTLKKIYNANRSILQLDSYKGEVGGW